MRILVIGGTRFVGRHLVEAALAAGHHLTLFNRGRTAPDLFPQVEHLRGDREQDLAVLGGRTWDAVIDTCGYTPRAVRDSARLLAGAVELYAFVSTLSVYGDLAATHGDFSRPGMDEGSPVARLHPGESPDEVTLPTYGALKALAEKEAEEAMPGRVLIPRCGLVVGPFDASDRFTYWPRRIARGGEVLAPGSPHAPVQYIDVRDLAAWTVRMVETGVTGVFNLTGPAAPLTMETVLDTCREVAGSESRFTWVDDAFLEEAGVRQYVELPLWVRSRPETAGFSRVSVDRALATGLELRPLSGTVEDTVAWDRTRDPTTPLNAGLSPERERELLESWHARR